MLVVLIVMAVSIIFVNVAAYLAYVLIKVYIKLRQYNDAV
ncbi:MAG: hypothetical protein JWP06_291 [Candidatus Saccharibacteria bacterium]|nr:hypothetical protein [Candidatus Saccharibacteria bacterium]